MRRTLVSLATLALAFPLVPQAHAALALNRCTVRRYSAGVSSCTFVSEGVQNGLWLDEFIGDSYATMVCTVGSTDRETTGTSYAISTGQCTVTLYVYTTGGDGLATGLTPSCSPLCLSAAKQ